MGGVDDVRGANALITGAAGGLGHYIASELGRRGARLALSGRRREPLAALAAELQRDGVTAEPVTADLRDLEQAATLVTEAEQAIGPLDLLISNAGIEIPAAYPSFTDAELSELMTINLLAPMVLTRHALPGMLARGRGHVVLVSSLAGRGGNAYNALYASSKAGLLGLGRSLRAELAGTPVGCSVICPGFIAREGMYPRMQALGVDAPWPLRPVEPDRVARAVVAAIRDDRPDVLLTAWPMRPLLAVQELAPRLAESIVVAIGAPRFFARLAALSGRR